ncbi:hypothetical protein EDD96_3045 [Streptomyces sp. Ag109_G2-6]|uniref:hypothetical protein n=1 Tax=Streptomyces TaxID=1883 RepID=UPI0009A494AB|nr:MULTISPECIES: hypothetical protein [Streptomyces]RPF46469.1 hypothetical protein EDD96_3045 [Streptomyces sp. Ag109_G2-6]
MADGTSLTEFLCITHEGWSPQSLSRIYIPRDLMPADLSAPAEIATHLTELRPPLAEVRETARSRLADSTEEIQLGLGTELLDHAREVLADTEADPEELHLLAADLTGALHAAIRVAKSRGHRLASRTLGTRTGPPAPLHPPAFH